MKNGNMYSKSFTYFGKKITFVDSYKMIPAPLKSFPKMFNFIKHSSNVFNFNSKKEYIPYKIYSEKIINNPIITFKELENLYEKYGDENKN